MTEQAGGGGEGFSLALMQPMGGRVLDKIHGGCCNKIRCVRITCQSYTLSKPVSCTDNNNRFYVLFINWVRSKNATKFVDFLSLLDHGFRSKIQIFVVLWGLGGRHLKQTGMLVALLRSVNS